MNKLYSALRTTNSTIQQCNNKYNISIPVLSNYLSQLSILTSNHQQKYNICNQNRYINTTTAHRQQNNNDNNNNNTSLVPTEPTTTQTPFAQNTSFVSRATRTQSVAHHRNIRIKHRKLNDLCRLVRGLSVNEAINQLKLSNKLVHAKTVINTIVNAANSGVVNFNMNRDRLYVAEIIVGKAPCYKIPDIKGRTRTGIIEIGYSHLTVIVKEQLPDVTQMMYNKVKKSAFNKAGKEIRIGKFGRKLDTLQKDKITLENIKHRQQAVEKAKQKIQQDAS